MTAPEPPRTDQPTRDQTLATLATLATSTAHLSEIADDTVRSQRLLANAVVSLSERIASVEQQLQALWRVEQPRSVERAAADH